MNPRIFLFCGCLFLQAAVSHASDNDISPEGRMALSMDKELWKRAETEHFIYHFIDEKEAETILIHSEVYYQWVKDLFGVTEDRWTKKAHIFVFRDEAVWKDFRARAHPSIVEGEAFTSGWELFIYRAPFWMNPMRTMAHEITHVVVFRFLDGPVPLFLNEGFADFVSFRALAMQMGTSEFDIHTVQLMDEKDYIPLKDLAAMTSYPGAFRAFYQESELLTRYLILTYGNKNYYQLLREVSTSQSFEKVLARIYGMDLEALEQKFKDYAIAKKAS